ncbi:hypothetical protein Plim_3888 [Planctopirus limnophila DSM 3776]|uniref:Uncharacterized protein n=1 Tax=Planctopirus limnophila (strain ATCC 43296 / DSM 3776 / IFAM 1008 / Mu 290) TaxID=521674 RepID=D5SX78_PLAL2|nr:hypothetical protein Plim_3888 [Planctopirus limnophila DSM 3776]
MHLAGGIFPLVIPDRSFSRGSIRAHPVPVTLLVSVVGVPLVGASPRIRVQRSVGNGVSDELTLYGTER